MLTDKEKEEIANLKVGFNIIKEPTDQIILASRRVEISRKWARKLLKISLYFNIVTVLCFFISTIMVTIKPSPTFYASTPSGKIIGPLKKLHK